MKIIVGCISRATANKALTSFSPSPNHFDVRLDALMLRKLAFDSVATALANNVFPFPGGPNKSRPFGGLRNPVNKSGLKVGKMTISLSACLATS